MQSITTGLQNMSTSGAEATTRPPQPNFSFPRKVRDRIYGYLLHNTQIHDKPYYTRATEERGAKTNRDDSIGHTYRFYTNILAVNKQISDEASKILKSNNFVLVSHNWYPIERTKHILGLPIITENNEHIARFKHHIMQVRIAYTPHTDGPPPVPKPETFLIVAEDLPKFSTIMTYLYYSATDDERFIIHWNGTPPYSMCALGILGLSHKDPTTTIKFQDKAEMEREPAIAKSMLLPFQNMIVVMHNVRISNAPDSLATLVQSVVQTMGPKNVWVKALAWHMLETLQDFSNTADALALAGDSYRASLWYESIWQLFKPCLILHRQECMYDSNLTTPIAALYSLMLRAGLIDGFHHQPRHNSEQWRAKFLFDSLQRIAAEVYSRETLKSLVLGMIGRNEIPAATWLSEIYLVNRDRNEKTLKEALETMRSLSRYWPHSEHFKHDWNLLEGIMNDTERRTQYFNSAPPYTQLGLISMTASVALETDAFTIPPRATLQRPSGLDGFVDSEHFEKIRAAEPDLARILISEPISSSKVIWV